MRKEFPSLVTADQIKVNDRLVVQRGRRGGDAVAALAGGDEVVAWSGGDKVLNFSALVTGVERRVSTTTQVELINVRLLGQAWEIPFLPTDLVLVRWQG